LGACIERNQEKIRKGESIKETFKKAKRILSSVIIRRCDHEVNNHNVVNIIQGNRDRINEAEKKALRKKTGRNTLSNINCYNTQTYQTGNERTEYA
jgi:hypothetical protein